MSKYSEPHWLFEIKYQLWRRFKDPRYGAVRRLRRDVYGIEPGGLVIDCGANVGEVTAFFLDRGFQVHAFEPDPDARAILSERLGQRPGLVVHPHAVGARSGRARLHRMADAGRTRPDRTLSSSLVRRDEHGEDTIEVEVIDLLDFIAGLGRGVDIVKLDIEGAEVDILDAILERRMDREIGQLLVETHERFSPELAARTAAIRRKVEELAIKNIDLDWI